MAKLGVEVTILTGIGKERYQPLDRSFQVLAFRAWDFPFVFRISLQVTILFWLLRHSNKLDVIMLTANSLFIVPFLRLFGWKNIHLDFRTVPVEVHNSKDKLDSLLYWKLPLYLLEPLVGGHSFITKPLQKVVEREFGRGWPDSVVWSSGVNCSKFGLETNNGSVNSEFTLLYHGSIGINRGLPELVDAIGLLSDEQKFHISLILIGDGSGMDLIREKVRKLDLAGSVIIKGMLPYEDIPHEISLADCCICPLPDRMEWNVSSPLKVFEYMASGKPIILTPIPAHKAITVSDESIVWSKNDGALALKKAIEAAMINIEQLKVNAKRVADLVKENYDWASQAKKLTAYLDRHYEFEV